MMDVQTINEIIDIVLLIISGVLAKFHFSNRLKINVIHRAVKDIVSAFKDDKISEDERKKILNDIEDILKEIEEV